MPDPTDHDVPCLWETGRSVTLHFGAEAVQSQMSKDAPNRLEFEYTRLMAAFLPFHPEPADILIVGLGGGSLSKFCHHHLPDSRITTVEINPEVIALRDTFLIPPESPRFRIICADAVDYAAARRPAGRQPVEDRPGLSPVHRPPGPTLQPAAGAFGLRHRQ